MAKALDELARLDQLYEVLMIAMDLQERLVDVGMSGLANSMFDVMADITSEYDQLEGDDIITPHPFEGAQADLVTHIHALENLLWACNMKARYTKRAHAEAMDILMDIKRVATFGLFAKGGINDARVSDETTG
jgi:hypothetical protein